jgi:hypothetical protein
LTVLNTLSSSRLGESAWQIAKSAYIRSDVLLIYSSVQPLPDPVPGQHTWSYW